MPWVRDPNLFRDMVIMGIYALQNSRPELPIIGPCVYVIVSGETLIVDTY